MKGSRNQTIRIAILDMYEGRPNEGMRCIRQLIDEFSERSNIAVLKNEFDVRIKNEVPDMSYDIFISSGGPGSPLYSKDNLWETSYFNWLQQVYEWNDTHEEKKHIFFICHSFQLACRYLNVGNVCKRKSTAFGVFPVHLLQGGEKEPVFAGMDDPIYAVDSRDYQVILADTIHDKSEPVFLAIEKERPHVPLERAIMAIRFNKYMIGTQFHPEADASGMSMYLQTEEKKKTVIENYGEEKWQDMIRQLNDPDKIMLTYSHILPNFLRIAVKSLSIDHHLID